MANDKKKVEGTCLISFHSKKEEGLLEMGEEGGGIIVKL